MLRILHTADWHIGKSLYRQPLNQEMIMFFDWLYHLIVNEQIDVLLISGDIFDYSNPAHQDTAMYYDFLTRISYLKTKVIITGGNHDSISMLNAPGALLRSMNIAVFGGLRQELEDHVVPIADANQSVTAVIAAIPFLRNKDIKSTASIDTIMETMLDEETAIAGIYHQIVDLIEAQFPNIPIIAMGHLFMKGSITSDSERDIHIGTLQGINKSALPPQVSYYALGHIHKPQMVGQDERYRYSGSPIFLDFSERFYTKQVIQIDIDGKDLHKITTHAIPIFRNVSSHRSNFTKVKEALNQISVSQYGLKEYVDIIIEEEALDPIETSKIVTFIEDNMHTDDYVIARYKISSKSNALQNIENTFVLNELNPMSVFEKFLQDKELDTSLVSDLKMCYAEILESIQESEL